jgi:hypothetical protein
MRVHACAVSARVALCMGGRARMRARANAYVATIRREQRAVAFGECGSLRPLAAYTATRHRPRGLGKSKLAHRPLVCEVTRIDARARAPVLARVRI